MESSELKRELNKYQWYHIMKVADGVYTPGVAGEFRTMWDFNLRALENVDFEEKKVLDVGCRDGLFSFEAEQRGAREIVSIDNDLSRGAADFLIPFLKSKVRMYEMNLLDMTPEKFGTFDIILFFGVLYHLRYPVWGLKKLVECLSDRGILLIESGMLIDRRYEDVDFIYCPVEESPYEPTSCTFFNRKGLDTTMRSLGCETIDCKTLGDFGQSKNVSVRGVARSIVHSLRSVMRPDAPQVGRQFLTYRNNIATKDRRLIEYWNATHEIHTGLS